MVLGDEPKFVLGIRVDQSDDDAFAGGAAVNELNLVTRLEPVERQLVKVAVQDAAAVHDVVATELGDDAGDVAAGASFVDAFDAQEDGDARPGGQAGSLALRIGRKEL